MKPTLRHIITLALIVFFSAYACNRIWRPVAQYEVHGIDVSHHQQDIDWERVADQDIAFAFIKATEGATFRDSLFRNNWLQAKRAGIMRGGYHFFRPATDAHAQADQFIREVEMASGDLPPVLDVEVLDGVDRVALLKNMYIWLFRIEIAYGIKPIIYTNQKFYNRYLAGYFDDYPLWIARYNALPPRLLGESGWDFWQYGDRARIEGITGPVDVNVYQGSYEQLVQSCLQPRPVLSAR